jgi:uncharacterized protein YgiB involved in biofilm formation
VGVGSTHATQKEGRGHAERDGEMRSKMPYTFTCQRGGHGDGESACRSLFPLVM